jgi:hypothetical protein
LLSIWAIPEKIAADGAKSLASVAAPLHPAGFLELRPNNACTLLFCSAALQLRKADSTGSVTRILDKQAWNGAKRTIFEVLGQFDAGLPAAFGVPTRICNQIACLRCNMTSGSKEK